MTGTTTTGATTGATPASTDLLAAFDAGVAAPRSAGARSAKDPATILKAGYRYATGARNGITYAGIATVTDDMLKVALFRTGDAGTVAFGLGYSAGQGGRKKITGMPLAVKAATYSATEGCGTAVALAAFIATAPAVPKVKTWQEIPAALVASVRLAAYGAYRVNDAAGTLTPKG